MFGNLKFEMPPAPLNTGSTKAWTRCHHSLQTMSLPPELPNLRSDAHAFQLHGTSFMCYDEPHRGACCCASGRILALSSCGNSNELFTIVAVPTRYLIAFGSFAIRSASSFSAGVCFNAECAIAILKIGLYGFPQTVNLDKLFSVDFVWLREC